MNEEIDWMNLPASARVEPSKLLYKALKAVSDVTGREIDLLMDDAYGEPNTTSAHYASNFRRGKVAAGKAMMIHKWLAENHFEIAQTASPELFHFNPKSAWELFVEEHAKPEGLRIVPMKREMGILSRAKDAPKTITTLRLGQLFCFEMDCPFDGFVVAFEGYKGQWHSLPLGADERQLRTTSTKGMQLLPCERTGKPIELEEPHDTGQHDYIFILATNRSFPTSMMEIARASTDDAIVSVHKTSIRFVT